MMLVVKNVNKGDMPKLIEYMMLTLIPYCSNDKEKLKAIDYANKYITDNYMKAKLIVYNFKVVGAFIINDKSLDMLYIERKYRFKRIGTKILKRIKRKIDEIKVVDGNESGVRFGKKNGFDIDSRRNNLIILRRVDECEHE